MKNKYIIYDIGGTFIKWAIVDNEYNIIEKNKFPFNCKNKDCKNELIPIIGKQIIEFQNKFKNIKGIGISTAGDVNRKTTEILGSTPNHKNYTGINFKNELSKYTSLELVVDNDANCAILGETTNGLLKNIDVAILITLGTDIGGGIIINNDVYRGWLGTAGEVGYMNVLGKRWGTYFSAIGLSRIVKEKYNKEIDPNDILKNDKEFEQEINFWYQGLSIGIANLISLFNPKKIIIGGGLSESKLINLNKINEIKNKILIENHLINSCQIELSSNGNDSAIYGCVKLLNQKFNE